MIFLKKTRKIHFFLLIINIQENYFNYNVCKGLRGLGFNCIQYYIEVLNGKYDIDYA